MRVLITGASGFLGANLCKALQNSQFIPVAAIRKSSDLSRLNALAPDVETIELDLNSASSIEKVLQQSDVDTIINCAGYGVNYEEQDPYLAFQINVLAAVEIANFTAQNNKRLIQIGTSYEYGDWDTIITEKTPLRPTSVYGRTKAAASLAIAALAEKTKSDILIIRLFSMYGPLEGAHKLVPVVMSGPANGEPLKLTSGEQKRDYTYVGDVAEALINCIEYNQQWGGRCINVCSGVEITLKELISKANRQKRSQLEWGAKPYRADELMCVVGDPSIAKSILNWNASTDLANGLAKTSRYDHFRK